jgi:hypothetical protein
MSPVRQFVLAAAAATAGAMLVVPAVAEDLVTRKDGKTVVEAPTTRVAVDESTGDTRVRVRAPASKVDVDTERGHVRIRVPYFDGDIRW